MNKFLWSLILFFIFSISNSQVSSTYSVSFENAVHHEAKITAEFTNLTEDKIEFRMSRSSPGRYALHEFAKNVYGVQVTNSKGDSLIVNRPDPYSWVVEGHDGTINVSYVLFGNFGDGTYAQIDETHAHLNMPATFMYVPSLAESGFEITFNLRKDLNWKVATQLKHISGSKYYAKDLHYFMDSPTEISDHSRRSFDVDGQSINFVLHHAGTEKEFDAYFKKVIKVVQQQKKVFGTLPEFDYGNYTFLACYMPNVDGDGMEHRNSTVLTSASNLSNPGNVGPIATVSHEFFHAWNVERIRPASLEPFNFEKANMSGELWFGEGFTSYYTNLILCRAGIINEETYLNMVSGSFNSVWNSSGREFFNPIEMSYQAPFVDAAKSVDEVNKKNTYISYYTYGNMLGLALDLSLRERELNLDDYMKLVWKTNGEKEIGYTIKDLESTLSQYAGKDFANEFFSSFIYKSEMPNFKRLFKNVGVELSRDNDNIYFGTSVKGQLITEYPSYHSPAYEGGLTKGDKILKVEDISIKPTTNFYNVINKYKAKDSISIIFDRFGTLKNTTVRLESSYLYQLKIKSTDSKLIENINRNNWLKAR